METAFRRDWNRRSQAQVRMAMVLGALMYAGFGLVDIAVAPERLPTTWVIRFGLVIPAALLMLAASFTRRFVEHLQVLIWGLGVGGGLGIVAITTVMGEAGQVYYSAGILLLTAYLGMFTRMRFAPAVAAFAVVIGAYAAALAAWTRPEPVALVNQFAFIASVALVSGTCAYAFERSSRLDFLRQRVIVAQAATLSAALANVRELSGLIPICAWCKRIRDDDGYWNQLETYLRARSRAEFSHGMCPDCFRIHGGGAPATDAPVAGGPGSLS